MQKIVCKYSNTVYVCAMNCTVQIYELVHEPIGWKDEKHIVEDVCDVLIIFRRLKDKYYS